ncbi:hypothetical protein FB451DRAFT_1196320 [Mycena latifolia]|nr:hypothetical protein FB451DRAFT_1196320 [Mycena latifolia]
MRRVLGAFSTVLAIIIVVWLEWDLRRRARQVVEQQILDEPQRHRLLKRISFVLLPWAGRDGEETLPELFDTAQSKLAASRFLRVRKLVVHRSSTSSTRRRRTHRARAEDVYEILCNDVVLPLDMSIGAVRQYVWRQSGELTTCYRRNRDMTAYRGAGRHK